MSLKTWGVKLYPNEIKRIRDLIQDQKTLLGLKNNRDAFLKLLDRVEEKPIINFVDQGELDLVTEDLCEMDFLKKIVGDKTGIKKWFCLRSSRPDRAGKPILMGDGKDYDSIKKLCQACKDGYMWSQQQKLSADQITAINKFGDSEIEAHLFVCNHPDIEYVQLTPSANHDFLCLLTGNRQSVQKKCLREPCNHLLNFTFKVIIKETPQYEELQKQLEEK